MTSTQIAVRLPAEQIQAIDRLVPEPHATRSDVVRRALALYLYRLACERDAALYEEQPLTDLELSLADDASGWASVPKW